MKIKQLLPILATALVLSPAVFADPSPTPPATEQSTASQELTLTVTDFINIWVKSANPSATIDPNGAYTSFTIPSALTVDYGVLTNKVDDEVQLTVKAGTFDDGLAALASPDKIRIAFVNVDSGLNITPGASQVASALAKDSDPKNNANVIALDFSTTLTNALGEGFPVPSAAGAVGAHTITYTLKPGTYDFLYTSATSEATSLSTLDEVGHYKATLTLSHVSS